MDLGLAAGIEKNLKPVQMSMKTLSMETVGIARQDFDFSGGNVFTLDNNQKNTGSERFDYERLADATVDAFERADFSFKANNRELGRFVRGVTS